jgi:hypothetical protein
VNTHTHTLACAHAHWRAHTAHCDLGIWLHLRLRAWRRRHWPTFGRRRKPLAGTGLVESGKVSSYWAHELHALQGENRDQSRDNAEPLVQIGGSYTKRLSVPKAI